MCWKSPGGLVKTQTSGPPQSFSFYRSGDGPRTCICDKFSGTAVAAGSQTQFENWSTEGLCRSIKPYMLLKYNWDNRIFSEQEVLLDKSK